MKKGCKIIVIIFILLVFVFLILVINSNSEVGTFTNIKTKEIYKFTENYSDYNDKEQGIKFIYPNECDVEKKDDSSTRIFYFNEDRSDWLQMTINTDMEQKFPFNKVGFNNFMYTIIKHLYPFQSPENSIDSLFKLEKINNKSTMVFYNEILSENNIVFYTLDYYYINLNNRLNNISIMTTNREFFEIVVGTIEY